MVMLGFDERLVLFWSLCLILCATKYTCLGLCSEKAMAPHSSTLAWKIPWTEEPGRLQSMGSRRVGHNWSDSAAAAATGLCWWSSSWESACQFRGYGFDLWFGKIPRAAGQLGPGASATEIHAVAPMLCKREATAMRRLCIVTRE